MLRTPLVVLAHGARVGHFWRNREPNNSDERPDAGCSWSRCVAHLSSRNNSGDVRGRGADRGRRPS